MLELLYERVGTKTWSSSKNAGVAQLGERFLGMEEVVGSNPTASFIWPIEKSKPMTPLQLAARALMIYEANNIYIKNSFNDRVDPYVLEDLLYFKNHFFNHSDVKKWGNPEYKLNTEEAEALEIIMSLGW